MVGAVISKPPHLIVMTYKIIQPPFTLKFSEMSRQELVDYAVWFHGIIDDRIAELEAAVRETPSYGSWTATVKTVSLETLGEWFAGEVKTRPRTPGEMTELKSRGDLLLSVPEIELTNRSFSLAIDVGMYVARIFERSYQELSWTQFLDNKRFADYGQPVLTGFGPVPLNPIRIALTLAYGIAAGKQTGNRLMEIFDYWSKQVGKRKH
jgi:hypothetical protein